MYSAETVDFSGYYSKLETIRRQKGKNNQKDYFSLVCAFDIETTTIYVPDPQGIQRPHSFMYLWQVQIDEDFSIMGRTWEEFDVFLDKLKALKNNWLVIGGHKHENPYFVFYIHNAAYEWQWLQGRYRFENEDCFFREARKPLYYRLDHLIEFRCSYLHSNMSLAKWAENTGVEIQKLDGELYDYKKVRYPWTPLTDYEIEYGLHDVKAVVACIKKELARDNDRLNTIPLTSTGYVRRDMKKALESKRGMIKMLLPEYNLYNLLQRAFRGGDTHANRYRVNTISGPGKARDIESSYPAQLLTKDFPMGPFRPLKDEDTTPERIVKLIAKGNAVVADYVFKDIRLKDPLNPIPYLPLSKAHFLNAETDNGRIISADLVTIALTEIDLEIVMSEYDFSSVSVHNAYLAIKGPLPAGIRETILHYYYMKTTLKGVTGSEYEYVKLKNKLNSTYGNFVQRPIHENIFYNPDGEDTKFVTTMPHEEEATKELEKANFPYQWGVWCTAYARKALRDGMRCIGKDKLGVSNILYCDTDSIKYIGDADFSPLNAKLCRAAEKAGATAKDKKGNMHHVGEWTADPDFVAFKTLGAKRYAYVTEDGKIHITVSGVEQVPHKYRDETGKVIKSVPYCVEELIAADPTKHPLDNFAPGMIWREAGGQTAIYNDNDDFDYTDPVTGRNVHIGPNISIVDSTYTMELTSEYEWTIEQCAAWIKYLTERGVTQK